MSEQPVAPVSGNNPEMKPGEEVICQDEGEVCNKDSELMMVEGETIEDEKMPSYMNVTSISSSTKPDDSRIESDGQTQPQSEGDGVPEELERDIDNSQGDRSNSSVVELVSSGEESDRDFERIHHDIYKNYTSDEEERDYDDDDDEEEDVEDEEVEDEEEEDDEAEYMRRHEEDDEDYSDGEIEAEQFERSSDDFVLRPSEALETPARERSRSLQDLTSPNRRSGKFNSKRQFHGVQMAVSELDGRAELNVCGQRRSSLGGPKYGHVPSKVKQYIDDMKEQRRLSRLRRSRDPLDVNREFAHAIKRDQNMETDIRVNPQSRLLKSYMESNMKHMIVEDPTRAEDMTLNRHLVENGAEIISVDTGNNLKKSYDTVMVMEVDKENEIREDKCQRQLDKKNNGVLIDYSTVTVEPPKAPMNLLNNQEINPETLTNGTKDETQQITNCQSVSYEDFLKGNFDGNSDEKPENNKKKPPSSDPLELPVTNTKNLSTGQIETISEDMMIAEKNSTENSIISLLRNQLNQKIIECNGIKEDYKKIATINLQLKNDYNVVAGKNHQLEKQLSELKKTLAQLEKEKQQNEQSKEMRAAKEVQTEALPAVFDKSTVSHLKVPQQKISGSSIASAPSSMDQWTDSNCSPSVSLKPPNVGSILNSEESFCLGQTPRQTNRPLSQAFYTSSRILQTLANITQGKSDPANPNTGVRTRNNGPGQSKEPISPLVTSEFRSRKRKASDNDETSAVGPQPFKMPFLSNKLRRKFNSDSETDAGDRTTADFRTSQKNAGNRRDEDDNVEVIDVNDGIKCYVYKEDDDSKERSFLLQAEETNKVDNNGIARECGPFLLANLEVRMSEANGTLNIWGKEINQESTSDDVEEELEEDLSENSPFWTKTPVDKLRTTQFVCSTNKKSNRVTPTSAFRSRIPKKLRTVLSRAAGPFDDQMDRAFGSMPNLDSREAQQCRNCNGKQRGNSPVQKRPRNSPCCAHNQQVNDYESEIVQHSCGAVRSMGCRGISVSNPANLHVKHSCTNYVQSDVCKHQISSQATVGQSEDVCCHVPKRCHSIDIPCNSRAEDSCSHAPLVQSESSEVSDNAKRRVSGKRVRGILRDFLKSCGDCRHPQTTSFDASHLQTSETAIPDIRVTPASDFGRQYQPHSSNSDRAPNSMADFQLQFEQLMADVEKINMRSRTLFQMMNTLCNMESQ